MVLFDMRATSPLTEWREQYGLSTAELADLCNVLQTDIIRIEAGEEGIVGEVQDYLTRRGENVCSFVSDHSEFLAGKLGEAGEAPPEVDGETPTAPSWR